VRHNGGDMARGSAGHHVRAATYINNQQALRLSIKRGANADNQW